MDIEERFNKWLDEEFPDGMGNGFGGSYHQDDMEAAYLAGAAQAQKDYVSHYERNQH